MAKYIKNDVVKMKWEADKFIELNGAFYAAVQVYNGVHVVFKDNDAFVLRNEANPAEIADFAEIVRILQECVREGYLLREDYEDLYVSLRNGSSIDGGMCDAYGVGAENADDIGNRIADLSPYFEPVYVDNPFDAM